MPPLTLEGENLGKRHKYFNSQVNEVIKNKTRLESILSQPGDSDVDNLFKIDIASKYKNVEYIVEVLKSEDMLYVSRAIKKSTWLITEDQYAHIINPQHLHSELFPYMTSKAICKLTLHIRLHLRQEQRVEQFYRHYEPTDVKTALKWLPNCPVAVIEEAIIKYNSNIEPHLFKKLCEKAPSVYEIFMKKSNAYMQPYFKAAIHVLNDHPDKYLDSLENLPRYSSYQWPTFGKKHTAVLMKYCSERIFKKIELYAKYVDIETVGKFVGQDKLKELIVSLSKHKELEYWFTYDNIKPLIKVMDKEGKFEFLKSVFIDKVQESNSEGEFFDCAAEGIGYSARVARKGLSSEYVYQWYRHATFDIAFPDLKKLIKTESSPDERAAILRVMLTTAGRNINNIHTLLQYYHEKHINEPFKYKNNFLNAVISVTNTHKYEEKTWKILDEIFHSAEVYIESDNNVQICLEAVITYKLLHKQEIPAIIEKKFKFSTMKVLKKKLKERKDDIFNYLHQYIEKKIRNQSTDDQDGILSMINLLTEEMNLLSDWEKELVNYPLVTDKIKELLKLKYEKRKTLNLEALYNKKKSWRKYLFEESLLISRSETTYMNALKHDPTLFERHAEEVEAIRRDDSIVLLRLLRKLKIYWTTSLTTDWINAYQSRMNQPEGHKALLRGLCVLLPQKELLELVKAHAPDSPKIVWSEIDELLLSLRKNIGRLMYHARPQPPPSVILPYAQGDYLQYALPSLSSIFYNMSSHRSRDHLPQLLSGPVSLQKHGIRLAFSKLKADELKDIFFSIWKSSKNATIRAVIFQLTFNLLCREKDAIKVKELWHLLGMFIDNLSSEENSTIYRLLGAIKKVPKSVQGEFCMKSYKFLKTLPAKLNCQNHIDALALSTSKLMDSIDPDFVAEILMDFNATWLVKKKILKQVYGFASQSNEILSAYLLCTEDNAEQMNRFNKIMKPWLNEILLLWDEISEKERIIEVHFFHFLRTIGGLVRDNFVRKKYVAPLCVFTGIITELESKLPVEQSYMYVTFCKLFISYIQNYNQIKSEFETYEEKVESSCDDNTVCDDQNLKDKYKEMWSKICPLFAADTIKMLNEDMEKYFLSIQAVFAKICIDVVAILAYDVEEFYFEKELVKDTTCVPAYILAIKTLPHRCYDDKKDDKLNVVRKVIMAHSSKEVRMHYYKKYSDFPIVPLETETAENVE